ncbi:MAG: ThuA domain-containing protein [Planctomycetota bacterium]
MRRSRTITICLLSVCLFVLGAASACAESPEKLRPVEESETTKITEAMPDKPAVEPKEPRKMLVFWRCEGFYHGSIPVANKALEIMGEKTGAFEVATVTDDYSVFTKESLKEYDLVCLNNTTHLKFNPEETPDRCEALMDFIKSGGGLVGIHAAADNFYQWPEAQKMMGNKFSGHPWGGGGTWAIKLDEPNHPLTAPFDGKGFKIKDELYRTDPPLYSRDNQLVVMSVDTSDPKTGSVGKLKETDHDTGISWIKTWGEGRVFYCGLGHNNEVFWNPPVLEHFLLGIQYAAGDYPMPTK